MKMKFIILLLICFFILSSCSNNIDPEEEAFIEKILAVTRFQEGLPVLLTSLSELIETTHPNLIVRCKITERFDSIVRHPKYTNDDLDRFQSVVSYIVTPYELEFLDVYYCGEDNIKEKGDKIIYDAPYGIIGEYEWRRHREHPVLRTNTEYIMFIRYDEMYGEIVYYSTYSFTSALKIEKNKFYTDNGVAEDIFSEFDNDVKKLVEAIKNYVCIFC